MLASSSASSPATRVDPVLARMRAVHLKATADAALAAGNAGEAAAGSGIAPRGSPRTESRHEPMAA